MNDGSAEAQDSLKLLAVSAASGRTVETSSPLNVAARKDEVVGNRGRNGFTFASLTWKIGGRKYKVLTPELHARMAPGDGVLIAHGVAKNDPYGMFFSATPTFCGWRASGRCACRALAELELRAAVAPTRRAATPLFGPEVGSYFSGSQVDAAFNLLLTRGAGLSEAEARDYSVHSFRIFVACALLAVDCPRWLIKRMLRWRGDEALDTYARVSNELWEKHGAGALTATVDARIVPQLPSCDLNEGQQKAFLEMAHAFLNLSSGAARAASARL